MLWWAEAPPGRRGWGPLPRPGSAGQGCAGPPEHRASGGGLRPPSTLQTESERQSSAGKRPQCPRDGGAAEDAAAFASGPRVTRKGPVGRPGSAAPPTPRPLRSVLGRPWEPQTQNRCFPGVRAVETTPPTPTAQHCITHPVILWRDGKTNGASGAVFWGRCVNRRMYVVQAVSVKGSENRPAEWPLPSCGDGQAGGLLLGSCPGPGPRGTPGRRPAVARPGAHAQRPSLSALAEPVRPARFPLPPPRQPLLGPKGLSDTGSPQAPSPAGEPGSPGSSAGPTPAAPSCGCGNSGRISKQALQSVLVCETSLAKIY